MKKKKAQSNCEILYKAQEYGELLKLYKDNEDAEIIYYVGMANLHLGNYDTAEKKLKEIEKELKFGFESFELLAFARKGLVEILMKKGESLLGKNPKQALICLQKAYKKLNLLQDKRKLAELCLMIARAYKGVYKKDLSLSNPKKSIKLINIIIPYYEQAVRMLSTTSKERKPCLLELILTRQLHAECYLKLGIEIEAKRSYRIMQKEYGKLPELYRKNSEYISILIVLSGKENLELANKLLSLLPKPRHNKNPKKLLILKAIINAKLGMTLTNRDEKLEKYNIARKCFNEIDVKYVETVLGAALSKNDYYECLGNTVHFLCKQGKIKLEEKNSDEIKGGLVAIDNVLQYHKSRFLKNINDNKVERIEAIREEVFDLYLRILFGTEEIAKKVKQSLYETSVDARPLMWDGGSIFRFIDILVAELKKQESETVEETIKSVRSQHPLLLIPSPDHIPSEEIERMDRIASGGFGEVHKARYTKKDSKNGVIVALKVPKRGGDSDEALKMIRKLDHKNVVNFFGVVSLIPKLEILEVDSNGLKTKLSEVSKTVKEYNSKGYGYPPMFLIQVSGAKRTYHFYGEDNGMKIYNCEVTEDNNLFSDILSDQKTIAEFILEDSAKSLMNHRVLLQTKIASKLNYTKTLGVVMEHGEKNLFDHITEKGGYNEGWLGKIKIIIGIVEGLDYLHCKGYLHRDIKSDNIIITEKGIPKWIDFDFLAQLPKSKKEPKEKKGDKNRRSKYYSVISTDTLNKKELSKQVGTSQYHAPEVIRKKNLAYNKATDIFSCAMVIWEIVSGISPPYRTLRRDRFSTDGAIEHVVLHQNIREIIPPTCPPKLRKLLFSMWLKDQNKRFDNAGEALIILKSLYEDIKVMQDKIKGILRSSKEKEVKVNRLRKLLLKENWLSIRGLSGEKLELLLEALEGNKVLDGLDLSGNSFSDKAICKLVEIIKKAPRLRGIALNGVDLHGERMQKIAAGVKEAKPSLYYLEFRGCQLTKDDVVGLIKQCKTGWLGRINLANNPELKEDCFKELTTVFEHNKKLIVSIIRPFKQPTSYETFRDVFYENLVSFYRTYLNTQQTLFSVIQ